MINTASANRTLYMHLEGDFDALAVEEYRLQFDEAVNLRQHVTINLEQVEFIDSSGIGAMVFLFKRLRAKGLRLQINNAHGQPLKLMRYLRIDKCIELHVLENQ